MITERGHASISSLAVPAARVEDLVTTEASDEVLVYDQAWHHIHHLNQTSAVIWRLCDGSRSVSAIALSASAELGKEVSVDLVRLAVNKLAEANLLQQPIDVGLRGTSQSRRTFMKRAAVAGAVAVPAIVSMTAPALAAPSQNCGNPCSCNDACNQGTCPQCSLSGHFTINPDGTCTRNPQSFCCQPSAQHDFYCGADGGWNCGQGDPPFPSTCTNTASVNNSNTKLNAPLQQNSAQNSLNQMAPTDAPTQPPAPQATQPPAPVDTQAPVDQQSTDQSQGDGAPADVPTPTPTDTPPPPPPPVATMPSMQTNNALVNPNGSVSNPGTTNDATNVPNPAGG